MVSTNEFDNRIRAYVHAVSARREHPVRARLREATSKLPEAHMQISPEQGQFMALLAKSIGAKRAIEVGVFTGYSALCIAEQLPDDGILIACDVSEKWTSIARRFWEEAGIAGRIDLRLAPAAETLAALIEAGQDNTYDFAFVDADKEAYDGYYEQCLTLLRPGGVMVIDNMFQHGRAIEPEPGNRAAMVVHELTNKIFADDRVDPALIAIRDGVLLARKR